MYLPTRQSLHNVSPTLSDVVSEAIREDAQVELKRGDHGYMVVIDGVDVAEIATESFDYPLKRMHLSREAEQLANEYVEKKQRRRIQRRIKKLRTQDHCVAEGLEEAGVR